MNGKTLKAIIKASGLEMQEVAERIKLTPQALNNRLNAESVKIDFLKRIGLGLNKSVNQMMIEAEAIENPSANPPQAQTSDQPAKPTGESIASRKANGGYAEDIVVPVYGDNGAIATPGMGMVADGSSMPTEYRKLARSLFDDAQAILPVFGNSMTPGYPPSTELALRLDNSGYIEYGEVYVLELHGSDIPLFKRVLPSPIPGEVILASDNEMIRESGPFRGDYYYPPQPIAINKVRAWWVVLGDQKRRKNKQIILRNLREQNNQ